MEIAQPIVRKINDNFDALKAFEREITSEQDESQKEIIAGFPTVYIHNWKSTGDYEIYIGESNNVFQRTRQHYETGVKDASSWQRKMQDYNASLYIIGHEHFNKSMTLDVENALMRYMSSLPRVRRVHNLRGNPQNKYYPVGELDAIFSQIWSELHKDNMELFPDEREIRSSALFKASPLHKLTQEQIEARELIIARVERALGNKEVGQLIFVEGEAGTGKTVLSSSTFYEMYCRSAEKAEKEFRCSLIVNHDEQKTVYSQIAEKLGLTDRYGEVVEKPTRFINTHSPMDPVDVVFVDEGHLLWTQGKQSYRGENQLEDIITRARVTVVMFDENQILTTEQFWEAQMLDRYRRIAKEADNYVELKTQLRMQAGPQMMDWIDSFTKKRVVLPIPPDTDRYCIQVFATPEELDAEICKKAADHKTSLSRLIATYDWDYNDKKKQADRLGAYWQVRIGNWHKPWNRELEGSLSRIEKSENKKLAWAEQKQTIGEVGSTFTIQGFDLCYAGVILGPSVKYRNGRIVYDPSASSNEKAVRNRTLSDGTKQKFGESLLQHEVRVLMTRGVNGLLLYACDDELRRVLLSAR